MKKNDDLFHLIKSLTKSEKRYFKLFARQGGDDKNYMLLFDAIDEQEYFDDKALYARFEGKPFAKQLHVLKHYLYNLILKAMRVYNSAQSIEYTLQEAVRDADFLVEKGLFLQAKKVLDKADDLAAKHESYAMHIEVLRRLREVVRELDVGENGDSLRIDILRREQHIHNLMVNINNYRLLSAQILYELNRQGLSRTEEDWRELDLVFDNELLRDESQALTDTSRCFLYHIRGAYYSTRHEMHKAYEATKSLVETYQRRKDFIAADPTAYIYALFNHSTDCYNLERYDELLTIIENIHTVAENETKNNRNLSLQIFKAVQNIELTYCTGLADFRRGERVAAEVEKGLRDFAGLLDKNTEILFSFKLGILYFYMGKYTSALKYINRVINEKYEYMREDIYCFARISALFLHYDLGNIDLLENMLRSTYAYLAKRNRIYKVELLVMMFIKKLRSIQTEEQRKKLFQQMLREAEVLNTDPFERNAYAYIDILVWLRHKVYGTPMAELIPRRDAQTSGEGA